MKFEHFIIALLAPVGLLLIAGGAAFQQFQYWAMTQGSSHSSNSAYTAASLSSLPEVRLISNRPILQETSVVKAFPSVQKPMPEPDVETSPAMVSVAQVPAPEVKPIQVTEQLAEYASVIEPAPAVERQVELVFPLQPTVVVYDDHILLEFPKQLASQQNIKRAISRVLLSPNPYAEMDLLSVEPLEIRQRPAFYRRVYDQNNQPIRYPRAAFRYADHLIEKHQLLTTGRDNISLKIPLVASNLAAPARDYEPWVMQFSQDYNVPPALVFAIMETESHFNPFAVSRSNALGLMQIKPNAAGRDVYQYIDFRLDAPSDEVLFDAQANIRIGTAYLSLLKHDYFAGIQNKEAREMIAISSYNGGLSTVWRLFGDSPAAAVEKINKMNPRQVYRKLRYDHASDETRRYIEKVLEAKARYQALLGDDANILASR